MFTSEFTIHNMLYIPDFSINLIYVSNLYQQSKYKVSFTHDHCFIQYPIAMKMIGSVESFEGLYDLILKDKHVDARATYHFSTYNLLENSLWHFRFGHLYPTMMQ